MKEDRRFRWNFIQHLTSETDSVIFSHPETLRSFSFRRDVFESMFKKFPIKWEKNDFLHWAETFIENPEDFHRMLEGARIIIPDVPFEKHIPVGSESIESLLTLEELALGCTSFSGVKLTSVLVECPHRSEAGFTLVDGKLTLSSEVLPGHFLKVVSLPEARYHYVLKLLQKEDYKSLLDYGCYKGGLFDYLRSENAPIDYLGYDKDRSQISRNQKTYGEKYFSSELPQKPPRLITLVEVLEHMEVSEAETLVKSLLEEGHHLILTMPNADFNQHYPSKIQTRHPDHKHEWTKNEFGLFLEELSHKGFAVSYDEIGRQVKGDRPTLAAHIRSYRGSRYRD